MNSINPNKVGLALGVLGGGWHLMWAILVSIGWAQPVLNFVFWIHFLKPPYMVQPFHAGTAALLVGVTAVVYYVIGYMFGALWNWIHR